MFDKALRLQLLRVETSIPNLKDGVYITVYANDQTHKFNA